MVSDISRVHPLDVAGVVEEPVAAAPVPGIPGLIKPEQIPPLIEDLVFSGDGPNLRGWHIPEEALEHLKVGELDPLSTLHVETVVLIAFQADEHFEKVDIFLDAGVIGFSSQAEHPSQYCFLISLSPIYHVLRIVAVMGDDLVKIFVDVDTSPCQEGPAGVQYRVVGSYRTFDVVNGTVCVAFPQSLSDFLLEGVFLFIFAAAGILLP